METSRNPSIMSNPDEGTDKRKDSHRGETHGTLENMDKDMPVDNVRAPNVLARVKEEIEALAQTVHEKKSSESKGLRKDIDETTTLSDVKAPNLFERAREEIEVLVETIQQKKESRPNGKETHGMRKDIDEGTPVNEVKAPNVFERAKEEIEALVQTINQKKDARSNETRDQTTQPAIVAADTRDSSPGKNKAADLIKKAKEDIKEMIQVKLSPRHHKKSHGKNDQIDTDTPLSKVKAPNMFERAKEEIDALVKTIHQKKEAKKESTTDSEGAGFGDR